MFNIPSILNYSFCSRSAKSIDQNHDSSSCSRSLSLSLNYNENGNSDDASSSASSTITTFPLRSIHCNNAKNRVTVSHGSIRYYFCIYIFHVACIFHVPARTLGAVIPAMTLFGDDFGDGAADGVDGCCRRHNVPDLCRNTLCNPQRPPNDFEVYDIFERHNNCSKYLKPISHCLAAGRDHSTCCERDAKDGDEHTCFSMCRGEDRCVLHEAWNNYQTCLAINIRSMFECFLNGYSNGPTPPRKLAVDDISATSASLQWHKPMVNAHLVTRYIIYLYQLNDEDDEKEGFNGASSSASEELYFETDEPRIELGSLDPGTKYRAYAVAISDDTHRSLRSKHVDFQTAGIAPRVYAFKSSMAISPNASSVLLTCKYKVSGISEAAVKIKWTFRRAADASKAFMPVEGFRFNHTSFLYSAGKPREFVAILEIKSLNPADFGAYRCSVADVFGEGTADVVLKPVELHNPPSAVPPLTPLACCRGRDVDERCLPMCGGASTSSEISARRYVARPFMPSNCSGDISKVLSCAMPEVDDSACCLRERVPRQCMYLCDSSMEPLNQMAAVCLHHVDAVVQCRMAGVDKRPTPVTGLRIETGGAGIGASAPKTALVSWESSRGAEIYHVYWRRKRSEDASSSSADSDEQSRWHQKSQITTSRKNSLLNSKFLAC